MPTYKNTGATLIYDEGIRIEAGDTVQTNQWLVSFPANLTKLSDTPMVDPVI